MLSFLNSQPASALQELISKEQISIGLGGQGGMVEAEGEAGMSNRK